MNQQKNPLKEDLYKKVEDMIGLEAYENLEALHDMYDGYMQYVATAPHEERPSKRKIGVISATYEQVRDLFREGVRVHNETEKINRK